MKNEKLCYELPGVLVNEYGEFYFLFCTLDIPKIIEEEIEEPEPYFPPVILPPGIEDEWEDTPPVSVPSEDDPLAEHGPVWWYHSDHLSH